MTPGAAKTSRTRKPADSQAGTDKKSKTPARKSLIGEALVTEGVITAAQLERALKIQSRLEQPRQIGDILIELGFATRQAIADVVAKAGATMRIGDMLVEQGIIQPEQLDMALKIQKQRGKAVGEILVELGYITERILLQNLANQARAPYIEPNFAMIDRGLLAGVSPDYLYKHTFVPFSRSDDGRIVIVVSDLKHADTLQAIDEIFRGDHILALGPAESIRKVIEAFRTYHQDLPKRREAGVAEEEDSIANLVEHIVTEAIKEGASDIHIEPFANRIRLRYRIDGVLQFKTDIPKDLLPKIASRFKVLAEANITETRRHQGGRISFKKDGSDFDLRLSCYVTVHGESLVLRILNQMVNLVGLDELGMTPTMLSRFRTDVLDPPTGVVIITGPTGSGKTTTLYSSLDYCNEMDTKIITVEDPVEYVIDGIVQCSVHQKAGRTFEESLREIVRQDPDIIVLGEIRDRTTVETAIQAALTGHKVYSTFHTEDTIGGLMRLLNMEIEAFLISSTVISVCAQRLLRRICPNCSQPYSPPMDEIRRLGLDLGQVRQYEFKKGQGCDNCNYTGYRGRVGVYELLVVNDPVKDAIIALEPAHKIRQISMETTGLISMREDAIAKAVRGKTTFSEALRLTPGTFGMRDLNQILTMTQ